MNRRQTRLLYPAVCLCRVSMWAKTICDDVCEVSVVDPDEVEVPCIDVCRAMSILP